NFSRLVGLIQGPRTYSEGIATLELAVQFQTSGLNVSFAPLVPDTGKVPDLRLRNPRTGEDIFVEISALNESNAQRFASDAYSRIMNLIMPWFPVFCGRMERSFVGAELADMEAAVKTLTEQARTEQRFCSLEIADKIVLGIAPEHDVDALRKWGQARGLQIGHSIGPSFTVDELARLAVVEATSKITKEQKQLPTDRPNLIIITADHSLLFYFHNPVEIILSLRQAISSYAHIFAVAVSSRCGAGRLEKSIAALDDDLLIRS